MFAWLDPFINVTPASASSWVTVDVASYVPEGATGIMLDVRGNAASSVYIRFGVRKPSSSDDCTNYLRGCHRIWPMTGIDAQRHFQCYVGSTTQVQVWLVGYTTDGVTYFTNGIPKPVPSRRTWYTIDCSADAPGAIALIFQINPLYAGQNNWILIRPYGSSFNSGGAAAWSHSWSLIPCDSQQRVRLWQESVNSKVYLIGYVTQGGVFYIEPISYSATVKSSNPWHDFTAPSDASGVFLQLRNNLSFTDQRKKGRTEQIEKSTFLHSSNIEVDSNHIFQVRQSATAYHVWLFGYALGVPTPTNWDFSSSAWQLDETIYTSAPTSWKGTDPATLVSALCRVSDTLNLVGGRIITQRRRLASGGTLHGLLFGNQAPLDQANYDNTYLVYQPPDKTYVKLQKYIGGAAQTLGVWQLNELEDWHRVRLSWWKQTDPAGSDILAVKFEQEEAGAWEGIGILYDPDPPWLNSGANRCGLIIHGGYPRFDDTEIYAISS